MANLFDYVVWRGDLDFDKVPFGKIDALLLAQISYCLVDGFVSESFDEKITLKELANRMKNTDDLERRKKIGYLINKGTTDLLFKAGDSVRFGSVQVCGYKNVFNEEISEQFAAFTFIADKKCVVSFRGTDDSIVGWKEDFNIAWQEKIPSVTEAENYLCKVAKECKNKIVVIGHSKGGHLAVAASSSAEKNVQKRIEIVYNFDGPGFEKQFYESTEFNNIKEKLVSVYPELSIVGMIFYHPSDFEIVKSDGVAVMEHDALTWQVCANGFDLAEDFNSKSKFFYKAFNEWAESLSKSQIEQFVKAIFSVIEASEAKSNSELMENSIVANAKMIAKYASFEKETKKEVRKVLGMLADAIHNNSPFVKLLRSFGESKD